MADFSHMLRQRMDAGREAANLKELAFMRKRPIYGRSCRSTNSKAVTSKNHHRQSNYQMPNDNKSLDFVYYSDSEDEPEGGTLYIFVSLRFNPHGNIAQTRVLTSPATASPATSWTAS